MSAPADDVRNRCQGLLRLLECQSEDDGAISHAEQDSVTALRDALAGTDLGELVRAYDLAVGALGLDDD